MLDVARSLALVSTLVWCCSCSDDGGANHAGAGTAGNAGGSSGQAGSTGQGGMSPQAGGGGSVASAGSAGSAGSTSSTAGAGGGGTAGGGGSGGAESEPAWTCPAGPFPKPEVADVETLCDDFDFAFNYLEGPTWSKSQGALFFSNFDIGKGTGGDIVKAELDGTCELFTTNVGCNGLAVGVQGKLLGACQQSRAVQSFDFATKVATTLASEAEGKMLDTPNDLVVHTNGAIYFTNRTAEIDGRPVGYGPAVFWLDPQGTLKPIGQGDGNGIALSPDERTLYVNNLGTWPLDENGVPGEQGPELVGGDGLAVDCAGNLYQSGGQILSPEGESIGSFPGGTNMAFGGPDGTLLFVVSGGSNVRALHMNVPGIP
jgi:gluconolactonase